MNNKIMLTFTLSELRILMCFIEYSLYKLDICNCEVIHGRNDKDNYSVSFLTRTLDE